MPPYSVQTSSLASASGSASCPTGWRRVQNPVNKDNDRTHRLSNLSNQLFVNHGAGIADPLFEGAIAHTGSDAESKLFYLSLISHSSYRRYFLTLASSLLTLSSQYLLQFFHRYTAWVTQFPTVFFISFSSFERHSLSFIRFIPSWCCIAIILFNNFN